MHTIPSLGLAACLALAAAAAPAQQIQPVDAQHHMANLVDEGTRCADGLDADDVRPFLSPSAAVKAVLLSDALALKGSEQFRALNDKERGTVVALMRTSEACHRHLRHYTLLIAGLGNKTFELKDEALTRALWPQVDPAHKRVMRSMDDALKASPDLAHFLQVHGATL